MITKKDLEEFQFFLNQNHLYEYNLGNASFNPGMLLLFQEKKSNTVLNDLIFGHEFRHMLLNASLYGKIIYFLKFISIDILRFCIDKNKEINTYWQIHIEIQEILLRLINNRIYI